MIIVCENCLGTYKRFSENIYGCKNNDYEHTVIKCVNDVTVYIEYIYAYRL